MRSRFFYAQKLLSATKTVAIKVAQFTKTKVLPTIISLGRLLSSPGQVLFSWQNFLKKFISNVDSHPITVPSSILLIAANTIVNLGTRIPAIYRLFGARKNNPIEEKEKGKKIKLGPVGNTIYFALCTSAAISTLFVSMNSYLGGIEGGKFFFKHALGSDIDDLFNPDNKNIPQDEMWKKELVTALALYFAASNLFTFIAYNFKESKKNSKHYANAIEKRDLALNRYAFFAGLVSFFAALSAPLNGFFSTFNSLEKLPFSLSDLTKRTVAYISSFTTLVSFITTNLPTLYRAFLPANNDENKKQALNRKEKLIIAAVDGAGGVDTLGTGMTTFNSDITIINEEILPTTPLFHPAIVTYATLSALSTAVVYFFFSVHGGVKKTLNHAHKNNDYQALPQDEPDNLNIQNNGENSNGRIEISIADPNQLLSTSTNAPSVESEKIESEETTAINTATSPAITIVDNKDNSSSNKNELSPAKNSPVNRNSSSPVLFKNLASKENSSAHSQRSLSSKVSSSSTSTSSSPEKEISKKILSSSPPTSIN